MFFQPGSRKGKGEGELGKYFTTLLEKRRGRGWGWGGWVTRVGKKPLSQMKMNDVGRV